jgi:putative phage-type endonuclease
VSLAILPILCRSCASHIKAPADKIGYLRCETCEVSTSFDTRPGAFTLKPDCLELTLEQGSREWLEARRERRMASETPAVMGLSPYQKESAVRAAKRGARNFVNAAMRKGARAEPAAREAYAARYGAMRPAVFISGDYGASLDGINAAGDLILEIKVPYQGRASDRWKMAHAGRVPKHDYAQIQHQLMVTGAAAAHFWVWDEDVREGALVQVTPSPRFWGLIRNAWDEFWPTIG